jgi:hypothetical protein
LPFSTKVFGSSDFNDLAPRYSLLVCKTSWVGESNPVRT